MTDILERLRETAECADYVVDREIATEAVAEIVRLRIDIGRMLLEREEAKAEAERLRDKASACEEVVITQGGRLGLLQTDNDRLRAALTEIRDAGPMTVDDQRWRVAKDALEVSSNA